MFRLEIGFHAPFVSPIERHTSGNIDVEGETSQGFPTFPSLLSYAQLLFRCVIRKLVVFFSPCIITMGIYILFKHFFVENRNLFHRRLICKLQIFPVIINLWIKFCKFAFIRVNAASCKIRCTKITKRTFTRFLKSLENHKASRSKFEALSKARFSDVLQSWLI